MQFLWNGNDGAYTDAMQWTPEGVPLYDSSDSAVIRTGTVVLSNTEPNNIAISLGGVSAATQPNLVLDNAALGPDVRLGLSPSTSNTNTPVGYGTITVQGYDTNYGTISLGEANPAPEAVTITIAPYGQLNQEGTINVGISPPLRVTGSGDAPATLNNDGVINVLENGQAIISVDVIGSGTIAFTSFPAGLGSGYAELGAGVSSNQHVSFEGNSFAALRIDDPSAFHGVIDGFTSPTRAVTLANTQATGAYFAQITPDSGALLVLNGQQVVDALTVSGAHPSNAYGVSNNTDGSTTLRAVFPTPGS